MKKIDIEWLKNKADDNNSLGMLDKIMEWRDYTLKNNKFIDDDTPFQMRISGLVLNCKISSAFSAIETYQEIFKNDNHFLVKDFIPENNQTILDIVENQGFY
jgi:hypothetical protein